VVWLWLTDVSDVLTVSIIRAMSKTTRRSIPEDSHLHTYSPQWEPEISPNTVGTYVGILEKKRQLEDLGAERNRLCGCEMYSFTSGQRPMAS
jgi:hypothetical protein